MHFSRGGLRSALFALAGFVASATVVSAQQKMIDVGGHKLAVNCIGPESKQTVLLMAGGGRDLTDWIAVQGGTARFARVCAYDRAGDGDSESAGPKPQTVDQIVEDLHKLLAASGEKGPYVLVPHSIAGIYARAYVTKYPTEVSELVLVDSAHEEQLLRMHEIFPLMPPTNDAVMYGFFDKAGQKLMWKTELPLVVVAHGEPFPTTESATIVQMVKWDDTWRELQKDLASRSTKGSFVVAEKSGHMVMMDRPDVVIQAIKDVVK